MEKKKKYRQVINPETGNMKYERIPPTLARRVKGALVPGAGVLGFAYPDAALGTLRKATEGGLRGAARLVGRSVKQTGQAVAKAGGKVAGEVYRGREYETPKIAPTLTEEQVTMDRPRVATAPDAGGLPAGGAGGIPATAERPRGAFIGGEYRSPGEQMTEPTEDAYQRVYMVALRTALGGKETATQTELEKARNTAERIANSQFAGEDWRRGVVYLKKFAGGQPSFADIYGEGTRGLRGTTSGAPGGGSYFIPGGEYNKPEQVRGLSTSPESMRRSEAALRRGEWDTPGGQPVPEFQGVYDPATHKPVPTGLSDAAKDARARGRIRIQAGPESERKSALAAYETKKGLPAQREFELKKAKIAAEKESPAMQVTRFKGETQKAAQRRGEIFDVAKSIWMSGKDTGKVDPITGESLRESYASEDWADILNQAKEAVIGEAVVSPKKVKKATPLTKEAFRADFKSKTGKFPSDKELASAKSKGTWR